MNTTGSLEQSTDERFHRHILTGLLPEPRVLVTDRTLRVLTILDEDTCMPVEQEQLTFEEARLFEVILKQYPNYCPYESLYACFYRKKVEQARDDLQQADPPTWGSMLRPIRNTLSRARAKVRPLGLDFRSMIEMGYMLIPAEKGIL